MIKFIRKKILEGIIKDFIKELPKYKVTARLLLLEKKDELLEKIETAVLAEIKKYFDEHLDK